MLLSLVAGCGQSNNTTKSPPRQIMRTDATPIERRLPKLGPLQSVWWHSSEITTNSLLSPPAHPAYRVWGFAQLEKTKAQEFSSNYEWQKMSADWTPDIVVTNVTMDLSDWNRSDLFTKDCKPQQLPGKLFFERSNGVVYFDIEVE